MPITLNILLIKGILGMAKIIFIFVLKLATPIIKEENSSPVRFFARLIKTNSLFLECSIKSTKILSIHRLTRE